MKNYKTYQIVDGKVKYIEDYTIGEDGDFKTYEDMIEALDELIGAIIDCYEVEEI